MKVVAFFTVVAAAMNIVVLPLSASCRAATPRLNGENFGARSLMKLFVFLL
jgi:hypothetical protein